MPIIRFATNVPQKLRLQSLEGRSVESQFGGVQHMFSAAEGAFYVSDTVGRILAEQFHRLGVRAGEPVEITKREVANGNGRKSIQWQVTRVGFAPGEQPPDEPPSELERQLAASIDQVAQRKAAAQAQTATSEFTSRLVAETNALVDSYAVALETASKKYGNAVKPDDVRALLVTCYINASKNGGNRNAA
jgi:hypothetical protein